MHATPFLSDLAVVLGVAALTAVLARLLKQPTVLGYLLAGLIVGPYLPFPLFAAPERVHHIAEFGVILVMFAVGLEFRIARFLKVLPVAGLTGVVQVATVTWGGFTLGQLFGWGTVEALFLGTGLAISSTMVVSKVFEARPVAADVRELVFGILVTQDVIAIVLIAAMTGVAAGGGLSASELAATLGELAAVLLGMIAVGLLVVPRLVRAVERLKSREISVVVAVGLSFSVALLADRFGYSVALGAFIAGMLVAESGQGAAIEHLIQPVRDMFAAVFFVSIGMTVDPVQAWHSLPASLAVFAFVVLGQFLSVSTAGLLSGNGLRRAVTAGLALGQVGEFGFILAAIGTTAGVAPPELQSILVTVAVLTTFTTPYLLALAPRVVLGLEHHLPNRVLHLLALHEAWLVRLRAEPDATGDAGRLPRRRLVRAIRFIALDAVGLLFILATAIGGISPAAAWAEAELGVDRLLAAVVLGLATLVLVVPLVAGIVRNAAALGQLVATSVLPADGEAAASTTERVMSHLLRGLVYLGVVAGVGFPAMAVLRPVIGFDLVIVLVLAGLMAVGVSLWRQAGLFAHELDSGAEELAQLLARQSMALPGPRKRRKATTRVLSGPPGRPVVVVMTETTPWTGHTVAELHLPQKCGGAEIVAVHRAGAPPLSAKDCGCLEEGDLVVLAGSADALDRARALLAPRPAA